QAFIRVQVLDAETGQPITGTVTTVGAELIAAGGSPGPTGPRSPAATVETPLTVDAGGLLMVADLGAEVTFPHTPQSGWTAVGNSAGEAPPNTVHLTTRNPDGTYAVVFYDARIRVPDNPPSAPPPPPPSGSGRQPTPPIGPGTLPT